MRCLNRVLAIFILLGGINSIEAQFCRQDIPIPGFNPTDLALDSIGRLWIQDAESNILVYNGTSFEHSTIAPINSLRGLNHQERNNAFSASGHELIVQKDGISVSNPESQGRETVIDLQTENIVDIAIDPWGAGWILNTSRELTQIYPCPLQQMTGDTMRGYALRNNIEFIDQNQVKWFIQDSTLRSESPDGVLINHSALGQNIVQITSDPHDRIWILRGNGIELYQYDHSPGQIRMIKSWNTGTTQDRIRHFRTGDSGLIYYNSSDRKWYIISYDSWSLASLNHPKISQLWAAHLDGDRLDFIINDGHWLTTDISRNLTDQIRADIKAPYRSLFIRTEDDLQIIQDNDVYARTGDPRPYQFAHFDLKLSDGRKADEFFLDGQKFRYSSDYFSAMPPVIIAESVHFNEDYDQSDYEINTYHPFAQQYLITEYSRDHQKWERADGAKIPNFFFTNGHQAIKLRAYVRGYKKESLAEKVVEITRPVPLRDNPWIQLALALLGIGAVVGFILLRERKNKKKENDQRKKYQEKIKVTQLERTALQLQMNPHFIFNSLNTIRAVMRRGDQEQADFLIQTFAGLMRSQLDMSRKLTTSVEDEVKLLRQYLKLEQAARNNSFYYTIDADLDALYDVEIPTMLLQPIVENAVIHGVGGRTEKNGGQIRVTFKEKKDDLHILIQDNGPGFQETSAPTTTHQSVAMKVINERLQMIPGASIKKENYHEAGISGARIDIIIPIS